MTASRRRAPVAALFRPLPRERGVAGFPAPSRTSARLPAAFAGLVLAALLFCGTAGAGDFTHPLERRLRLNLWGVGLQEAAREIHSQTGVEVLFYREDLADALAAENVYIITGSVELRTVLEALARRFAFRYRLSGAGKVEVARGYGWVRDEPALGTLRISAPAEADGPDGARGYLGELLKPLPLLDDRYFFNLGEYPLPDDPRALRGDAALPAVMLDYLRRAVDCLSGQPGDYPPSPGRPQRNLFARASEVRSNWEELLTRRVDAPRGSDIKTILAGIADQAEAAFVLASPPVRDGSARHAQPGERPGFGQVVGELAKEWDMGRRVLVAGGAVLFFPKIRADAGTELEVDDRSREYFWDGLAVAGLRADGAAERTGGGRALAARIRREVFPMVWRDPMCSLLYSQATGRLVVIAPENVVQAVARKLATLR